MLSRRSRIVFVIALVLLAIALFPYQQTIAPDWTVTTLDASPSHRPLRNITVREVWQQYSLDTAPHEEDRLTDAKGQVHFPRRTQRSSLIFRVIGCLWQVGATGIHASCGPDSYLVAFGKSIDTMDWADMSQEIGNRLQWQRSTLVLKPSVQ